MIRTLPVACLIALGAAAGAQAQTDNADHASPRAARNSYANPSAVIASELAFAQAAQDKGQWTAFAQFAAPDAVIFVPQMAYAQEWLKGRANPAAAVAWQPHEVWSSCDGSLMVSHGAWHKGSANGWFTTIWQRQPKGDYKWVLDHGDDLAQPLPTPEMIAGHVADCPDRGRAPGRPQASAAKPPKVLPPLDPAHRSGKANDNSLSWHVTVDPSGARKLVITWRHDGADAVALSEQVTGKD